ncbi:MAG TPA: hemerythrin domain-containing protein [Stellaceae bacterium]|nr:hemerythrin domain-containing protein [Stellaceae bacterium]
MYSNRVCQKLHDEHMATLALLERLERFVAKGEPVAASDSGTRSFLIDLAVAFESEVWHHFDFEEKHLFDYLVAAGDTELARHLTDEHVQIKTVGQPIIAMVRAAAVAPFLPTAWREFRPLSQQLIEQLTAHVHKEEGILVPLLQDSMQSDAEQRLYSEYVMGA